MNITVVIPTFDAPAERLNRAVQSAMACAGVVEVVVVDDGSAIPVDPGAIGGWGKQVRIIRQANAGPSAARNRGLREATGDYVVFLDDDDELIPDGVRRMPELAERFAAVAVQGQRVERRSDGVLRTVTIPADMVDRPLPEPDDVFMPIALFGTPGLLIDRRIIGGLRFDEGIWVQEDRDYLRRAGAIGPVCVSSQPAVLVHRIDRGSNLTSRSNLGRRVRDHLTLMDRHLPVGGMATERAREHWRRSTVWLVNQSAKVGVEPAMFGELCAAAELRGWKTPVKARLRAAVRSLIPKGQGLARTAE